MGCGIKEWGEQGKPSVPVGSRSGGFFIVRLRDEFQFRPDSIYIT